LDWIRLAQNKDQYRAVVNAVMNVVTLPLIFHIFRIASVRLFRTESFPRRPYFLLYVFVVGGYSSVGNRSQATGRSFYRLSFGASVLYDRSAKRTSVSGPEM
jgi:hypothetical protein